MKTIIQTKIKDDAWIASTPHGNFQSEGLNESNAVNKLIAGIRQAIKDAGEDGIEWEENPQKDASDDAITRHITGCWPPIIKKNPQPSKTAKRKDVNDAD